MASSSISALILFIAAVLVAGSVAGTLVTNVGEISASIEDHSVNVREKIDTEIDVISDPGSDAVYNDTGETITILVKNTGERSLSSDPGQHDVVVDGRYVAASDLTLTVVGDGAWRPGSVARLEIDRALETGEHRVVIVATDDREVFEFYVP